LNINIELIDVTVEDKGKYKVALVAYRDQGKAKDKKVMSFGAQEGAFKALQKLEGKAKGINLTVTMEKNKDGYWDWIQLAEGGGGADTSSASGGNAVPAKGNWETPEERATKQVYIVKQSSLSNAIAVLNQIKKSYEVAEVITLAKEFESFVFGSNEKPSFVDELTDDIPY
jgi:hypothetical protein